VPLFRNLGIANWTGVFTDRYVSAITSSRASASSSSAPDRRRSTTQPSSAATRKSSRARSSKRQRLAICREARRTFSIKREIEKHSSAMMAIARAEQMEFSLDISALFA